MQQKLSVQQNIKVGDKDIKVEMNHIVRILDYEKRIQDAEVIWTVLQRTNLGRHVGGGSISIEFERVEEAEIIKIFS